MLCIASSIPMKAEHSINHSDCSEDDRWMCRIEEKLVKTTISLPSDLYPQEDICHR
jgi:hypothetical protein